MFELKRTEEKIALDRSGIDAISDKIVKKLEKYGIGKKDIIRIRLTLEEQLLKISEYYKEKTTVTLRMGKRFATPYVYISYEGEKFDPTSQEDETEILFSNLGMTPQWSYHHNLNTLYLKAPYQTPRSEVYLIAAVIAAIIIGLLRSIIPAQVITAVSDYALTPVSDAFMNVLGSFVRFMIFFSVISGICSIESLSDFSKIGKHVTGRMIIRTFVGTGLSLLIALPFHHFVQGEIKETTSQTGRIIELIFFFFFKDLITPFIEGNTLQIIFLAVMIGSVMLILGEKISMVKKLINDLSVLFSDIISIVCKLLPLYIFTSLLLLMWKNGGELFIQLWKPIVLCLMICCFYLTVKIIYVCIRFRISPIHFLSAIKGTVLLGLVTASSSATLNDVLKTNEKKLGISQKLNRIGVPFANLLIRSVVGVSFVLIIYYMAEYYSVPVNIGWFITAWVMCSVLSIAAPPVSGGMLVVTGMLMMQLGIPVDGLAVAGLLGIVTDFICTASITGLMHCELLIDSDNLDMLDKSKLASLRKKR